MEEFDPRQQELNDEYKRWDAIGLLIKGVEIPEGVLGLMIKFDTLRKHLADKGIIDDEELNDLYHEHHLEVLKKVREDLTPMVQKARRDQITNGVVPPMVIPPNFPFKDPNA